MPKPAPRRQIPWRMMFTLSVWLIVFAGAAWAAKQVQQFVLTDPRFTIEPRGAGIDLGIDLVGVKYASRARVLQTFAPDFGLSAFHLPLAERRRRLLAIDWVADASILRIWPNRIVVRIKERTPAAFVRLASGHYLLIDSQGVLLSPPSRARFDLPVLTGVSDDQPERDRRARVAAMQTLLADLGPAAKQISEVNAASIEDLRITTQIDRRGIELWMGDRNFASRYQHFMSNYPEIRKTSDGTAMFDLRLDDRITTK
jgi:cell division protein FtsQ